MGSWFHHDWNNHRKLYDLWGIVFIWDISAGCCNVLGEFEVINMDYSLQYLSALPIAFGLATMAMYVGVKKTLSLIFCLIWLTISVAFTISALNYIYTQISEYRLSEAGVILMIISLPVYIGIIGTINAIKGILDVIMSREWAYR